MLNIKELEEKHKKYRLKKNLPYAIGALVASAIFALYTLIADQSQQVTKEIKKEVEVKKEEPIVISNLVEPPPPPPKHKEEVVASEPKMILTPSLGFLKESYESVPTIQSTTSASYREQVINIPPPIEVKIFTNEKEPKIVEPNTKEVKKEEVIQKEEAKEIVNIKETPKFQAPIEPKGIVNISVKNSDDNIDDVIKRFKNSKDPKLSLFIAKKYYQAGDYEQAYNYALATNNLNNNIEESWLIFAKTLLKLNKKDEAIETLQRYISFSKSAAALQLLNDIIAGKTK